MNETTVSSLETELLFANNESFFNDSTALPPQMNSEVLTIVLIVLAVIVTIALLFGMAVFIDCRHQKLVEKGKRDSERRLFSFTLPKFFQFRRFSNEEDSFADKIYGDENIIA